VITRERGCFFKKKGGVRGVIYDIISVFFLVFFFSRKGLDSLSHERST